MADGLSGRVTPTYLDMWSKSLILGSSPVREYGAELNFISPSLLIR